MTKRLQSFDTDDGQMCARMGCIDNHDRTSARGSGA
jgi:hypothetical protein